MLLIRQTQVSDFPRILDINATEEEKTSRIDLARITQLDLWSDYHRVAVMDDEVIGFLLVMSEISDYDGENFRWFVGDTAVSFISIGSLSIGLSGDAASGMRSIAI